MSGVQIRAAIEKAEKLIREQPEKARAKNTPATASLVAGLKCHVTGPAGESVHTDMPAGVGGGASAPNPGWLMRAALASCNATCIALRAAQRGITLTRLEVTVSSESDQRGLLGMDDKISAGLDTLRVKVMVSAPGTPATELGELARIACERSPVRCTDTATTQVEVQVM